MEVLGILNVIKTNQEDIVYSAGPLGLMGRELARQTSEPDSNPSWNATGHPVCETFNVVRVV